MSAGQKRCCLIIGPTRSNPDRKRAQRLKEIVGRATDGKYEVSHASDLVIVGVEFDAVAKRVISDAIVIADLRGDSAETYYLMALRHAVNKPIINLTDDSARIPKPLQGYTALKVGSRGDYDIEGDIRKTIEAIEAPGYEHTAPFAVAVIKDFFDQNATEKDQLLLKYLQKQLGEQFAQLNRVAQQIDEATRKPLCGIDEVFKQIWDTLKAARKDGGRIWFVGMTFGFGPPHRYRICKSTQVAESKVSDLTIDDQLNMKWPGLKFETMIDECKDLLGNIIEQSRDPVLVCLRHDKMFLTDHFLAKLCQRESYQTLCAHVDEVADEIIRRHKAVEEKIPPEVKPLSYVDSIPLQILIVEKDALGKKGCVVFHVGTSNIETKTLERGETGFYTEVDSVVDMFETMAQSLWESGQSPRQASEAAS
jgi:hypothetical protein